ncbi:coiled-coil-helix-coiled-coil-helix domain-containing protein 5 isoform X2 [Phycodurus eques]|uniref:coiled-coil-helix-coiled-coil-helix domain-containing protein 5 isoform X2 n=1 Tax=Phycodurus eques TaxID=693459 RepID=UPI002ACEBB42|nr:coiled-coil-helix-coiled-coil-helix domain-containing protein 5 isoform X2 [Phycodurus eques]
MATRHLHDTTLRSVVTFTDQLDRFKRAQNSKMQAAMYITAKYCHEEMDAYGSCVASNPSAWQEKCDQLKMKFAQCTSSHPVIQKIRRDCSKEFVEFEKCLRENQSTSASCSAHVARFLGCAETVDLSGVETNPVPVPS